jgi:nicotinate-nucleotide adenylyltransferase
MARIGIFGGTFDPPHLGHLILAEECRFQLGLDRLLWMVTAAPPHKAGQPISPLEMRVKLAQAAIEGESAFELSLIDINRKGPHYAVDTVRLAKEAFPRDEVGYIMGGDSLRDLPKWYHPQEFIDGCAFIGVMRRPSDEVDLRMLEDLLPGVSNKLEFVRAPLLEIASNQIRERIRLGQPFRYYLPEKVYTLICEQHWYFD